MQPVKLEHLDAFAKDCRYVVGPNAGEVLEALTESRISNSDDLRASVAARLGAERFARGETEDLASFEPEYGQAYVPSRPAPIFGARP